MLEGDWRAGSTVTVELRIDATARRAGRALSAPGIRLDGDGSAVDCAERICDVIRCAFSDLLGFDFTCFVGEDAAGRTTIFVELPKAESGSLFVCVEDPEPQPQLRIDDFLPKEGGAGTEIAISGLFPSRSVADYCAVVASGSDLVPLEPKRFQDVDGDGDSELIVELGALPFVGEKPGPIKPGPISVALGSGVMAVPDGLEVVSWSWSNPTDRALSQETFRPIPPTKPGPIYYGRPANGTLSVDLPPPDRWRPNTEFNIRMKAFGRKGLPGLGVFIPGCVGPTGDEAMEMLCGAIQSTLALTDTRVVCSADVVDSGDGSEPVMRLAVSSPDGVAAIEAGALIVTLDPEPLAGPVITSYSPVELSCGTQLVINGVGFPARADEVSLMMIAYWDEHLQFPGKGRGTPLRILEYSESRIVAEMRNNPPLPDVATINLAVGESLHGVIKPIVPAGIAPPVITKPIRVWRNGPGGVMTHTPFDDLLALTDCDRVPTAESTAGYLSEPPADGELCLFVDGGWTPNSRVEILCRLRERERALGFDLDGEIVLPGKRQPTSVRRSDLRGDLAGLCGARRRSDRVYGRGDRRRPSEDHGADSERFGRRRIARSLRESRPDRRARDHRRRFELGRVRRHDHDSRPELR